MKFGFNTTMAQFPVAATCGADYLDLSITEFAEASELQLEYMKSGGASVMSEALGDAKVTYAQAAGVVVGGQSVCPAAISKLMKCGLLTRWI